MPHAKHSRSDPQHARNHRGPPLFPFRAWRHHGHPSSSISRRRAPGARQRRRWFDPLLSERLAQAGFGTLEQLAQRINDAGVTWWYPVRGIGVRRAERVVQWLHEQQQSTGMEVNLRGLREHGRARSSSCAGAQAAVECGSDNAGFVSAATRQG